MSFLVFDDLLNLIGYIVVLFSRKSVLIDVCQCFCFLFAKFCYLIFTAISVPVIGVGVPFVCALLLLANE